MGMVYTSIVDCRYGYPFCKYTPQIYRVGDDRESLLRPGFSVVRDGLNHDCFEVLLLPAYTALFACAPDRIALHSHSGSYV